MGTPLNKKFDFRDVGFLLLVVLVMLAVVYALWGGMDGSVVTARLYSAEMFYNEFNDILVSQRRAGILTDYNYLPDTSLPGWVSFLPWLVLLALFVLLWYSMMTRQMGSGGGGGADRPSRFSRARTKTVDSQGKTVTFADVAGADEEKAELQEVVDFLQEPQRYLELGARIPKGICWWARRARARPFLPRR